MKTLSIIVLFIVLTLIYFYFDRSSGSGHKELEQANIKAENVSLKITESSNKASSVLENSESTPYSMEQIKLAYSKCNALKPTIEDYSKVLNKQVSQFSEKQLTALYAITDNTIEFCEKWEQSFNDLSNQQVVDFEKEKTKSKIKLNNFIKSKPAEKLKIAISVLKGEDERIAKNVAILHVLKNDLDLAREMASIVGTDNIGIVTNNRREILNVFKCQNDYSKCGSNSSQMIALCAFNEEYCGIDYFTYLDKSRTSNEVNDLYSLSNALRELIDGNYYFNKAL